MKKIIYFSMLNASRGICFLYIDIAVLKFNNLIRRTNTLKLKTTPRNEMNVKESNENIV